MNPGLSQLLTACGAGGCPSDFAVDVGAHHGEFSQFLLDSGLFSTVVSFEPNPENFVRLQQRFAQGSGNRHRVVNAALGSVPEVHDFHCNDDSATGSLLDYAPRPLRGDMVVKRRVQVTTLDEYLTAEPLPGRMRLLKIDTQGSDLAVILGARATVAAHRPIIQSEFIHIPLYQGQCSPEEISGVVAELGYRMYSLNNLHTTPEGRLAFCDAVFVPSEMDVPVTQQYTCIDDQISFRTQIDNLTRICAERLKVINVLDAEVRRLRSVVAENGTTGVTGGVQ